MRILCLLFCFVTLYLHASAEIIDMQMCPQEKSNWCWAASAQGILTTYHIHDVSQTEIVTYVKGSPVDQGGNEQEMCSALSHFGNCSPQGTQMVGEAILKQEADQYNPAIIGWTYTSGSGHAVAYCGYNEKRDRAAYKIMNPSPMGSGSWEMLTYQAIQNAQGKGSWVLTITTSKDVVILALTSMNNGGTYTQGDEVSISWRSDYNGNVDIELLDMNTVVKKIATVASTSSPYTWKIADDLEDCLDYRIKIIKSDETNVMDISEMTFMVYTKPHFTSDSSCSGTYLEPFSHTVTAEDNGDPSKLTLNVYSGLPAGVSFTDNKDGTGTLGGTPEAYGTFKFEIALRDEVAMTPVIQNFTLTIAQLTKPVITRQPEPDTVMVGETAVFTIEATGAKLEYQWKENGRDIPGETGTKLELQDVTLDDNGKLYQCVVKNSVGIVRSETVALTVTEISEIKLVVDDVKNTREVFAVCPNPVMPDKRTAVFIVNHPDLGSGTITVYDAVGSLIDKTVIHNNGMYSWDLTNKKGVPVCAGTYRAVLRVKGTRGEQAEYCGYVAVKR